ncbi:hypothetical protein AB9P05_16330 [Roseivirga sp. BDSF3-8]|uniref:hypothetical protein n=1 Tax=Roseivirga sp. BDSF3-8 TaxID=3241598 RepID=UPI00353258BD
MKSTTGNKTYMMLALAVATGLLFHGASFFNTLEDTYDIYVHIFFADHYAGSWFEPWENRWYTGFQLVSYPPLVHQLIALLSKVGGLKFGAYTLAFGVVILYVTGAYRFSKLISCNETAAGYAALIAVFAPSVVEALHVFGQLPMMMGIGWLLHSLPEIYLYVRYGKLRYFLNAISLIGVAVCSHHVTPIFGMVFFVLPLMATAVMDGAYAEVGSYRKVGPLLFLKYAIKYLRRIIIFGFSTIVVAVVVILPYWIYSKNDPIAQVPIPHGSRDSFIEVFSSGLVFFIIPWGFVLAIMPFLFYRYFSRRNLFLGLSFSMLVLLGTGGTTPIPKLLLGENAFSILTLERFTFWATIMAIPLTGEFLWRFFEGNIGKMITDCHPAIVHKFLVVLMVAMVFISSGFTMNLSFFRPLQPDMVELKPILNFLQSDKHYKWRFLTLGFGDQMAWLSANTNALTIDGNYHSARRVPELTTRAIERLENAKYRGIEGIGTLHQFLTTPETFHLKYIFSNDKFYDPMLYFTGWHRVKQLSNGIMVWERSDVSTLPSVLPKKNIPKFQKIMWGTVPLSVLVLAFFFNIQLHWIHHVSGRKDILRDVYQNPEKARHTARPWLYYVTKYWLILVLLMAAALVTNLYFVNLTQNTPEKVVQSYYDALDFKEFERAHSYVYPGAGLSLDQFLLQTSVTDGLVDSYGKLNNIHTSVLDSDSGKARVEVHLQWITPLNEKERTEVHHVIREKGRWYIVPEPFKNNIPVNQYFDQPENAYYNQGRRTVTTEETFHKDVLDRPVLQVHQASLVKKDGRYAVAGLVQNLDDYPADVTIKATLLDSTGAPLTSYYDKYYMTHKLLPKEMTAFRVDFEGVGWLQAYDSTSKIFDPDLFLEAEFSSPPVSFALEVLGSVATQDLYKDMVIRDLVQDSRGFSGLLFNYGSKTATISQIIVSQYDSLGHILWADHVLVEKSVFPRRHQPFIISAPSAAEVITLVSTRPEKILINGIANEEIIRKYQAARGAEPTDLIPVAWGGTRAIRLNMNHFIGNPAPF